MQSLILFAVLLVQSRADIKQFDSRKFRDREAAQDRLVARDNYSNYLALQMGVVYGNPETRHRCQSSLRARFDLAIVDYPHPVNLLFLQKQCGVNFDIWDATFSHYDFVVDSTLLQIFVDMVGYDERYIRLSMDFVYGRTSHGHYSKDFVKYFYDRGIPLYLLRGWVKAAVEYEKSRCYRYVK